MATGEEKNDGVVTDAAGAGDLYAVLGLKKECSDAELRLAYKKLAMRWHPDRCTAFGNSKRVEEAKEKFQQIQGAYSVLSDSNKRFLYDVGVYDSDDEDHAGMGEFLGEMAEMMSQIKPSDNGQESFEELQLLFVDMFQADLDSGFCGAHASVTQEINSYDCSASSSPLLFGNGVPNCGNNKRGSSEMNPAKSDFVVPESGGAGFCFGLNDTEQSSKVRGGNNSKRRNGRKQKMSSKHDVSSCDAEISASLVPAG